MELYQFCHNQQPSPKNVLELVGDIVATCETWYMQKRDGREHLVAQTISYLLIHAIDHGKQADVKRVCSFREALMLIDFQDESSVTMKQILLSCLVHPLFLHNSDGRKFLSCLFSLSQPFVDQLHDVIKGQLPLCKKSVRSEYAEIYFRAWKSATGPYLHKMEYTCIQDLMTCAVHAENRHVISGLRGVLGYFHEQKHQRGVDSMLTRLYEPIIWRSLKVANQFVRGNAAWLFVDAFPLVEADAPSRESDETLQKQFQLLQELLKDPTTTVREIAVLGVCQILGKFWEMIPVATSRVLLHKIINDMAFDTSSSAVRAAVFSGVKQLLTNNLSHATLKVLLPQLGKLIHDNSEQVRSSALDLLLVVKSIASIRFFDVAPVELILARLPVETPALAAKITSLMLDTYCPQDDSKAAVNRCLSFLESDPLPCRVFYSHVHKFVPLVFVCKLAGLLFRVVKNKGATKNTEDNSIVPSTTLLEAAVELIDILWTSVEPQLAIAANEALLSGLYQVITNSGIQSIYEWMSPKGKTTLLRVASHLPAEKTIALYEDIVLPAFSALGDQEEEGDEEGEGKKGIDGNLCYALLACLYKWDHAEAVLTITNEWLQLPLQDSNDKPAKKGKKGNAKRKKTVESAANLVQGDSSSKPLLALKLLGMLLQNQTTRELTLSQPEQVQKLVGLLMEYFPFLQTRLCNLCGLDLELASGASDRDLPVSDALLLEAFVLYCKLLIHINGTSAEVEKDTAALKNLLELIKDAFVPAFNLYTAEEEKEKEKKDEKKRASSHPSSPRSLPVLLAANSSMIITDFAVVGFAGPETLPIISEIFQNVLSGTRDKDILKNVAPYISKFIYYTYETASPQNWDKIFTSTTNLLTKVLTNLPGDLQVSSNFKLADILGVLYRKGALLPFLKEVMPMVWEAIEESNGTPSNPPTMDDVTSSTKFILSSFSSSGPHLSVLAHHLNQFITDSSEDGNRVWKVLQVISLIVNSIVSKRVAGHSALQNILIGILSKLPSGDSTSTFSDKQLQKFADSLLKESLREKAPKSKEKTAA
eukprot:Phypoly_transcript_01188.p1 GENE.Phypoly_transcript_01188~~Phypoly_transcript_01188.p1  ORF type:complete len:1187 (+),score=275.43 Phypoly_transcript_01188:424-3561(+)